MKTGAIRQSVELPMGRLDVSHTSAMNGLFFLKMDSQHGIMGHYSLTGDGKLAPVCYPPHPHVTTYQVPMSHAWVDGRWFVRGQDDIYCYDLRAK